MTILTRKELTDINEINIFEFAGFCGFPAGSDAVLAFRGITSLKPEERVLNAIGLTQNNEPGFQNITTRALNSAAEIVQMESSQETFSAYINDFDLILRGQGNIKALSEKNLKIALKAIRQRQDKIK
ncbi:MAG: hypothetical protein WC069_00750 [Candidatus Shapirobacteria bacterium]